MKISESQALNRMASYCSRAERCISDVRKKLISLDLSDEEKARIIKRLIDEKFLDEKRFCKSFINDKTQFNKWGMNKIIFELRKRGIPESVYSPFLNLLSNESQEDQLMHILAVKLKSVKGKDIYDKKNKLIRFALGRGFSMEMSIKCVNKLLGGNYEADFI